MKVIDFVEQYNNVATDNLKRKYIEDNLQIVEYISFADKCNLAERIVKSSSYERDVNGVSTGNIKINSLSRYMLFTLSVIDKYTNLEIDFTNAINEFDLLDKLGLIEILVGGENSIIPFAEYTKLQAIMNMTFEDFMQNNLTTQAFIQNQVTRFGTLIGVTLSPIMDKIADNINNMDEKTVEKLGNQIDKMFKRIK